MQAKEIKDRRSQGYKQRGVVPEKRAEEWGVRLRVKRPSKQVKRRSPVVDPSNSSPQPHKHQMWWPKK